MNDATVDQDIDLHIGQRLRARRRSLGLTQPQLAGLVGVRFQQIQKYECGEDRISAARLWLLCAALAAPVDYFYEGLGSKTGRCDETYVQRDAVDLVRTYQEMDDQPRRALLDLAKSLSDRRSDA